MGLTAFVNAANDAGVHRLLMPAGSYVDPGKKVPPTALVKNFGTSFQDSFRVVFTVDPCAYVDTETVFNMAPGETCLVWGRCCTLVVGLYTVRCSTMLDGDENPDNDTATAIAQGCNFDNFFDHTDGDLVASPSGTWTRGVPTLWVWPPMDSLVWGDRVNGYYDNDEDSKLTSPTYEALQNNPAIAFQHNFCTEASHDGGNFSYSTNNGSSWTTLSTCAGLGYNSVVSALGDDSGWSGGPSGWNQSVFTIPVDDGDTFKVRWRFASDASGTSYGWLIDEVAGIGCDTPPGTDRPPQRGDSIIATLDFSPNPVHGDGQLSYTLLKDCNVTIKLYDATGALVAPLVTSGFKKGVHTAAMDASRLKSGVYFVMIAGKGDVKSTKVTIE
jgi:hypothetical protein